ncbi:PepSY domain-containing protein [Paenibacillus sp. N3.4]|uniref:PepSY domain-containing protein n=1 Tax=Paenibacillus sp. N3.4 TaxID=2603222 RepID=UPI0021C39206|nr:PepSY domain-containing protein [Paenibacillus sp. N3.4]
MSPSAANTPLPNQIQAPIVPSISEEEALSIAQKMDLNSDAQWSATLKKNMEVEPGRSDKYTVWIVKALYKAGNTTTVTIDALTGQILSIGEGEPPSMMDLTSGKAELFQGITGLQMVDSNNGWALKANTVLRTTDGGITWGNVTPFEILLQSRIVDISAKFLDSQTAILAVPDGTGGSITVYLSNDGGTVWRKSAAVDKSLRVYPPQRPFITFVDKKTGWILAPYDAAMGSEDSELWQTTDGGETWKSIATATYGQHNEAGYPLEGIKTGVAFADWENGFLTGSTHGDGIWLYASHDGGHHWEKQAVSVPRGYSADGGAATSYPPKFFGGKEGILSVRFSTDEKRAAIFFVTQDTGKTWTPTTPLLPDRSIMEDWDFVDAAHGFATDGTNMYVTTDGAITWIKHPLKGLDFESIRLHFVSQNIGFAVGKTHVYQTTDGGVNWELIRPDLNK